MYSTNDETFPGFNASLYSTEVKQTLGRFEWPKGLIIDVVEYDNHLGLRLYRDNFETFDGVDKEFIAKQIGGAIAAVREKGCPLYLEVARGNGKG